MRIFVGGINTETNTFSPVPTGYHDFIHTHNKQHQDLPNECLILGHLKKEIEENGWECVPSFIAVAEPGGIVTKAAYEQIRDELLTDLKNALPLDIIILPLHGAMVADGYDDCEADIISRARAIVGPEVPIGVELDLHCHLSADILKYSDLITIFREYPHTDILERASDLLHMTVAMAQGKINPVMAMFDCQMVNLYPTTFGPMLSIVNHLKELDQQEGIISADIAHGFPWGDVEDCGTRTLVIADGNQSLAETAARELGMKLYNLRHELTLSPLKLNEALDLASNLPRSGKPAVLADQSDNAGGGAPSDSTFALQALLERQERDCAIGMIYDPQVVKIAMKAGEGAHLRVRLGGKTCKASGKPLDLSVEVFKIIPNMIQRFPQDQAEDFLAPCGDSVCLLCDGVYIIVNSIRCQVFHPDIFTQFGLDLAQLRFLIVKSLYHFQAGFAPVASEILFMSAPGALNTRFTEIPYKKVSTNKHPWVADPLPLL